MKRALAERAKQSELPNGMGPQEPTTPQPPQKQPRIDESTPAAATATTTPSSQLTSGLTPVSIPSASPHVTATTPSSTVRPTSTKATSTTPLPKSPRPNNNSSGAITSSPRPTPRSNLKRQRPGSSSNILQQDNNDADNEANAFYLKHQNRALASELKALQHQLVQLEKERDARRIQCQEARQAVQELESTWTRMETALQYSAGVVKSESSGEDGCQQHPSLVTSSHSAGNDDAIPMSTGKGESVEVIGALLDSLAALAKKSNDNTAIPKKDEQLDMAQTMASISQRASVLQQWIWSLLQKVPPTASNDKNDQTLPFEDVATLKSEMSSLQLVIRDYETRIAELAKARDEISNSDRRVRRGLYRLAAGRMKLEEVLKAVEDDDKDGSMAAMMALELQQEEEQQNASSVGGSSSGADVVVKTEATTDGGEGGPVDSAQLAQLKKQIQDLEEVSSSREKQIEQLLREKEEHVKRINSLALPKSDGESSSEKLSDDAVKRTSLYTETATKLVTAERQLEQLRERMKEMKEQWATSKGDAELATKTLEELQNKHKKRWTELTTGESSSSSKDDDMDGLYAMEESEEGKNGGVVGDRLELSKRVIELEHKLKQALENVRQADTVRVTLAEACKMNEGLQAKLEEMKVKNAALMAAREASRASSTGESALSSVAPSSSSSSKEKPSSSSSSSTEKLQREHRKMRKELAAAKESKEGAKAKQERAEKERDALVKTNSRLLKQSSEKDDMNAKSLSSILHLKHLTEQLEQEKDILEQKAKSSGQLALAARLAANAKERVGEEATKEKKAIEEELSKLQEKCESLQQAKEVANGKLAQSLTEMTSLEKVVTTSRQRCEELADESTKVEEEKRRLTESLAVAQREAAESSKKFTNLMDRSRADGSVVSEFTTEELMTQVSVLKGRLACPVCNNRDKKCILTRCRHMFCKQCVEENVRNRSRKCPACGQRFDTKDIADVWL